ncbi:MAG: aldose 1-epimerase [Flavobacteriaceae bacterium]|nr:aldose 1-epimerase [Flavobacteriaceae bacterium]
MPFKIQLSKTNQQELYISGKKASATIVLHQGASLQELVLDNEKIIRNLHPLTYKDTYASAILFPFASRIKEGHYSFNNQQFQLAKNDPNGHNALHGLVSNKAFSIIATNCTEKEAIVDLAFNEKEKLKGFPFTYNIKLTYILSDTELLLRATFTNTSANSFPFTYGWHPYFCSEDLSKSTVQFKSTKQVLFDDKMITNQIVDVKIENGLEIKDNTLDDCYQLATSKVGFVTPTYNLEIATTSENGFLQLYTPPIKNCIAIEPVSGVSDSFNNKLGLKVLHPKESYAVEWKLKLTNHQ